MIAPFVAGSLLTTVDGREPAWSFVKAQWDTMDGLYPKHGLRRMCEGVTALATPELERDVHTFFAEPKIDLGGKTLEQYLATLSVSPAGLDADGEPLPGDGVLEDGGRAESARGDSGSRCDRRETVRRAPSRSDDSRSRTPR